MWYICTNVFIKSIVYLPRGLKYLKDLKVINTQNKEYLQICRIHPAELFPQPRICCASSLPSKERTFYFCHFTFFFIWRSLYSARWLLGMKILFLVHGWRTDLKNVTHGINGIRGLLPSIVSDVCSYFHRLATDKGRIVLSIKIRSNWFCRAGTITSLPLNTVVVGSSSI